MRKRSPLRLPAKAALLAALLAAPLTARAGALVELRAEPLRAQASMHAQQLDTIPKGAELEQVGKRGGWRQVKFRGKTGWIRLLSAREKNPASSDWQGGDALAMGSGGYDAKRVVAVAGLRGLSEEDLKSASFNAAEMRHLDGEGVSSGEASRFAKEGGLERRQLARLPDPKKTKSIEGDGAQTLWGSDSGL